MAERGYYWLQLQLCNCNVLAIGLTIPVADVEMCILPFYSDEEKEALISCIPLSIFDVDGETQHRFTLKLCPTLSSYLLTDGWDEFLDRKEFMAGDMLTIWRDEIDHQFKLWITGRECLLV